MGETIGDSGLTSSAGHQSAAALKTLCISSRIYSADSCIRLEDGEPTPNFISSYPIREDMSRKAPADADTISDEELTELLAEADGMTVEAIERGAAEVDIAPPEEATIVDIDE